MSFRGTSEEGTCPRCNWADVRRSLTPVFSDRILKLVGLKPYRCDRCGHRFYGRSRPNLCPQCHTVNDDQLGWCEACGSQLPRQVLQRWQGAIMSYIAITVFLIGLIAAAVWFFKR